VSGGIPRGARWTPVPDLFFSRYLPALADPVAVKVALHVLWRIYRRPAGQPPALAESALTGDATLRRGLAALGVAPADLASRLAAALDQLIADGLLLAVRVAGDAEPERWVLLNGIEGQAAARRLAESRPTPPEIDVPPADSDNPGYIFGLYEANIGLVTPLLAEELADAAAEYPRVWVERAMKRAVEGNARRWSYVRAILERWARDGVDDEGHRRGAATARERDSEGPYSAWIER
jgi:DnaD/phage-associated family protein